mgnify:CR=1 FL=1
MQNRSGCKISLIIPVRNGGENFRRCLASVQSSRRPPDELIVVADDDSDGSWQAAEAFGAKVIQLNPRQGPAAARNRGAAASTGDVLFFIDADVTLGVDTLVQVDREFCQDPCLVALIGSYDDAPGASNFLSQYKNLFHHYTHQTSTGEGSTFWGACGAIRAFAFQQVQGFDERYRYPCVEDIDLGYRLKGLGYDVRLCKHIQVKHLKHWQLVSLLRAEIFYRALPWTELILSSGSIANDLNLDISSRASVVLTFLLLGCLALALVIPWVFLLGMAAALILLIINLDVYQFFYQKRGLFFTVKVVPWHWFYFLYGGAAFAVGSLKYYYRTYHLPKARLTRGF